MLAHAGRRSRHLGSRVQQIVGHRRFDARAEIVETPDGTLKPKKSLLMQAGKQVAADADASLDAAKDVVKGIINRKR